MISKHGHPDRQTLGNTSGNLFRDDKTYPVYLLENGKFGIKWGGLYVQRDSIKAMDSYIAKIKTKVDGLKILTIFQPRELDEEKDSFNTYDALEWGVNGKIVCKDGKAIDAKYSSYYVFDAKVADELQKIDLEIQKLEKAIEKLRDKRGDVKGKLVKVDKWNFEEVKKEHGEEVE